VRSLLEDHSAPASAVRAADLYSETFGRVLKSDASSDRGAQYALCGYRLSEPQHQFRTTLCYPLHLPSLAVGYPRSHIREATEHEGERVGSLAAVRVGLVSGSILS